MVGSIIGVGIANRLMSVRTGTSGVDWVQALKVGKSLLVSPLVGFFVAALLLTICKVLVKARRLYEAPAVLYPRPAGLDLHRRRLRLPVSQLNR